MTDDELQHLRESVSLADIVRDHGVVLTPVGSELQGLCPFHSERTPSFSVNDEKGLYHCFGCGASGDAFSFVQDYLGLTFPDAISYFQGPPANSYGRPAAPKASKGSDHVQFARKIWEGACGIGGTSAELYLHMRGIDLSRLQFSPPLRFAQLKHPETNSLHPTLLSQVTAPDGSFAGIQRTFLTDDGAKLTCKNPKLSLGRLKASATRLGPVADHILICEGLEDGLSLASASNSPSVWVACGAGLMRKIGLPDECRRVTIAADNDSAGINAALISAKTFELAGREARILKPEPGFKDFNAMLIGDLK